jgi:hypothetical protein
MMMMKMMKVVGVAVVEEEEAQDTLCCYSTHELDSLSHARCNMGILHSQYLAMPG